MEDKKYFKKAIFKQKISELRTKKFSFEINKIELPNGHEDEYGQIIFKRCISCTYNKGE